MPVYEQVLEDAVEPGNDPISAPHGVPLRDHAQHGGLEQIFGIGAAANALLEEGEQAPLLRQQHPDGLLLG
jgi:hypothetical protein